MSGYPYSRRPVSPMGGYYESREIRPDGYERQTDASNLSRYGTIRRTNGPPAGHPSERTYPELRRVRQYEDRSRVPQYEDNYGAAGIDVSSYGGGFPPSSYAGGLAQAPSRHRRPSSSRRQMPQVMSSGVLPRRSSSHRSTSRGPVADLGSLAGDYRPFNTPADGFERRPPPREYHADEFDLLDSHARGQRYASPTRRPSVSARPSRGSDLPTPDQFASMSNSRSNQYSSGYGGSGQPFPPYSSDRRPWR